MQNPFTKTLRTEELLIELRLIWIPASFSVFELKYPIGLNESNLENVQVSFNISYELIELD